MLQVKLEQELVPRKYHMCACYYRASRQVDVVVYGGNKRRKNKFERNVMTDMLIFRIGKPESFLLSNTIVNLPRHSSSSTRNMYPIYQREFQIIGAPDTFPATFSSARTFEERK